MGTNKPTVNELSNSIDLESTLIRAEALFRRFQRMVQAIDKKSNFPAPKVRHRQPTRNSSTSSVNSTQSLPSPTTPGPPASPSAKANTSGTDAVTVGVTNSGATGSMTGNATRKLGTGKGKKKDDEGRSDAAEEAPRPKVISPELRELLSTKVEMLPRKVVRKEGEGRSSLGR
jgi:TBC1 domain family member 15